MKTLPNLSHRTRRGRWHLWLSALTLAGLLAGLIPPPLVRSVADLLPATATAQAAPVAAPVTAPLAQGGPASISGLVYRDFNANGVKEATEPGSGGVTVTAYNASGAAIASSTASTVTATLGHNTP